MARAAQMPSTVDSSAAVTPTIRLFQAASCSAGVRASSAYHFQVRPVSGNFGTADMLTEKIGRKITGRYRKTM